MSDEIEKTDLERRVMRAVELKRVSPAARAFADAREKWALAVCKAEQAAAALDRAMDRKARLRAEMAAAEGRMTPVERAVMEHREPGAEAGAVAAVAGRAGE